MPSGEGAGADGRFGDVFADERSAFGGRGFGDREGGRVGEEGEGGGVGGAAGAGAEDDDMGRHGRGRRMRFGGFVYCSVVEWGSRIR